MIAARDRARPGSLVAYCSDQTHTSTQKAAKILGLPIRILCTDDLGQLRAPTLAHQLQLDLASGLVPFFLVVSIGTTGICASDPIEELAEAAKPHGLWVHVDAAYAGSALILPEFRARHVAGIAECASFSFNPHKWLQVNFDCSGLWVQDRQALISALSVDAAFFKKVQAVDFKDLQIPLGRRFRSLKVWFTLRAFGAKNLRAMIHDHLRLADMLLALIEADGLYRLVLPKHNLTLLPLQVAPKDPEEPFGVTNRRTQHCAALLDGDPTISLTCATFKEHFIIRVNIGCPQTKESHIAHLYAKLKQAALLAYERY